MRAGKLRYRLIIEAPQDTQSASGAPVEAWVTYAEVWGAVEPLVGRQFFAAQEIHSEITTRLRLRYLPGITQAMRVQAPQLGKIFIILAPPIDIESRHREMQLMVKELF